MQSSEMCPPARIPKLFSQSRLAVSLERCKVLHIGETGAAAEEVSLKCIGEGSHFSLLSGVKSLE